MSQSPVAALWRLRPYLRPYRRQLAGMIAAAVVVEAANITIPLLAKAVIDNAVAHHERGLLLPIGLLAVGLGAVSATLSLIRRWVQGNAVASMEKTIRDDMYEHLQRLDPAFHDEWQSGQLLSRATTDLGSIRRFAGFGVVFLIISIMTFIAVTCLLITLNWWLGLITGAMFAPVLVFCTRFERRYKVLARRAQDQDGDLTTLVEEAATGVRVLKALGRGPEAAQAHLAQAARLGGTRIGMARLLGGFWSTLDLVPNAVIALAVMLGAVAVGRHAMTIGGLVAFITLALQLVWPVEALGYVLASGEEAATAAQRVLEIFDALPAITSKSAERETGSERVRALAPPGTHPLPSRQATSRETVNDIVNSSRGGPERRHPERPAPGHGVAGEAQRAHVRFDRVSFAYPGSSRPVLREVTLDVAHGETLVITGATGSGKTTLLHLVPRLADVTGGRVLLGGTDVRDIPLPRLRAAVGCAFEEATLFSASVRENVTFGAAEATEEEIETALTAAQARFAYDLPWGLDTRIGEQGMALSGGQRQRVALARAILSRPEVLILDDPLSALDVATEERVTAALVGETGAGKTTVARLLARFYDPDAGRVLLDGVDLRSLPDAELRREIVLVTQESFLFEGTVAENIRLGRPSASDDEVEAAARAIGAHEFIASLPEGYATKVGKRGGKLSAGQRQLLSFCRAFIAAPSVLVLDEATALLDIPSERLVQSALHTVLAGRTALIIAHRLSTVAIADRVLVLRSGQVIEDGTPAELMGGTGEYADLHVRWAASLA